ncbi:hypothetical protein C7S13_7710 [Burkholderia cepacia]|nr:hypothetical protein [Burkholderia cepacia]
MPHDVSVGGSRDDAGDARMKLVSHLFMWCQMKLFSCNAGRRSCRLR